MAELDKEERIKKAKDKKQKFIKNEIMERK